MSLVGLLIALIVLGLLLWVVDQLPIDATIKRIIRVVIIVLIVIWLIQIVFGLGVIPDVRIGRGPP